MLWPDKIIAALPARSLSRIVAVLAPGESKVAFLREAVRRELERRETMAGIALASAVSEPQEATGRKRVAMARP